MEDGAPHIPRHKVIDSEIDVDVSTRVVMCHGSFFCTTVSSDDLQASSFAQDYSRLVGRVDGLEDGSEEGYESFCDWVLEPCIAQVRELARLHQ